MKFKAGDEVLVFYDGKLCRGTTGVVISTGRYGWGVKKHHSQITVKFMAVDEVGSVPVVATFRPEYNNNDNQCRIATDLDIAHWRFSFTHEYDIWYGGWTEFGYYVVRPRELTDPWYWPENMAARSLEKIQ